MTRPATIGRYEIQRELGKGGMATVYLARDPRLDRSVAVKVLPREFSYDTQFLGRFRREATVVAQLDHPGIVAVYDVGEEEGQPYLVMQYMGGGTLSQRLRAEGRLGIADTLRILTDIAPALDAAHAKDIVHRDLKPHNILFDTDGRAAVADFGIAKLPETDARITATGAIVGTPAYMSPEQARGEKVDRRTDVYSVGIMVFEMLAGTVPFRGASALDVILKHLSEDCPALVMEDAAQAQALQPVLDCALSKKPEERFGAVTAFLRALRAAGVNEATVEFPVAFLARRDRTRAPRPLPEAALPASALTTQTNVPVPEGDRSRLMSARAPDPAIALPASHDAADHTGISAGVSGGAFTTGIEIPAALRDESIFLKPGLKAVISPRNQALIEQWLKAHDAAQLSELLDADEHPRILLTGFGSFGGSSLMRGVAAQLSRGERGTAPAVALRLQLGRGARAGRHAVFVDEASVGRVSHPVNTDLLATRIREALASVVPLAAFLATVVRDAIAAFETGAITPGLDERVEALRRSASTRRRLILTLDRVDLHESMEKLIASGLLHAELSIVVVARKESYIRWPAPLVESVQDLGFRERYVRRLWKDDLDMCGELTRLLFDNAPEQPSGEERRRLETWLAHLAFKARGSLPVAIRELKDQRGWVNDQPQMMNIAGKYIADRQEIEHNAHVYRIVERNAGRLLESLFNDVARADRALIAIHYVLEWIRDNPIFSFADLFEAERTHTVTVADRDPIVKEVLRNLLQILQDEQYLAFRESSNDYKVQWRSRLSVPAPVATPAPEPAAHETVVAPPPPPPPGPRPGGFSRIGILGGEVAPAFVTQVVFEALQHGCAVVGTETAGISQTVKKKVDRYVDAFRGTVDLKALTIVPARDRPEGDLVKDVLSQSDVIVYLGGGRRAADVSSAEQLVASARERGIDVVPIAASGSAAAQLWRSMRPRFETAPAELRAGFEQLGPDGDDLPGIARAAVEVARRLGTRGPTA